VRDRVVEGAQRGTATGTVHRNCAQPVHQALEEDSLEAGRDEVFLFGPERDRATDDRAEE
jgi:hypothetical protein